MKKYMRALLIIADMAFIVCLACSGLSAQDVATIAAPVQAVVIAYINIKGQNAEKSENQREMHG